MADIKKVSIGEILDSQIPEFLNEDSPLFKEFLSEYYKSLEIKSGAIDLAKKYNITLIGFVKKYSFNIYANKQKVIL